MLRHKMLVLLLKLLYAVIFCIQETDFLRISI